jgi:hypothetical protein
VRLEDIDRLRRRLFGAAAVTLAAVRLGPLGMARAQAAAIEPALFGNCLLTYRSGERVRNDFDRRLQCLEPPLATPSMRPLARMAESVALDVLFDSG